MSDSSLRINPGASLKRPADGDVEQRSPKRAKEALDAWEAAADMGDPRVDWAKLMSEGLDVNQCDDQGEFSTGHNILLVAAAKAGCLENVEQLLARGATDFSGGALEAARSMRGSSSSEEKISILNAIIGQLEAHHAAIAGEPAPLGLVQFQSRSPLRSYDPHGNSSSSQPVQLEGGAPMFNALPDAPLNRLSRAIANCDPKELARIQLTADDLNADVHPALGVRVNALTALACLQGKSEGFEACAEHMVKCGASCDWEYLEVHLGKPSVQHAMPMLAMLMPQSMTQWQAPLALAFDGICEALAAFSFTTYENSLICKYVAVGAPLQVGRPGDAHEMSTPVHAAAAHWHDKDLAQLIEAGFDVNAWCVDDRRERLTPLLTLAVTASAVLDEIDEARQRSAAEGLQMEWRKAMSLQACTLALLQAGADPNAASAGKPFLPRLLNMLDNNAVGETEDGDTAGTFSPEIWGPVYRALEAMVASAPQLRQSALQAPIRPHESIAAAPHVNRYDANGVNVDLMQCLVQLDPKGLTELLARGAADRDRHVLDSAKKAMQMASPEQRLTLARIVGALNVHHRHHGT